MNFLERQERIKEIAKALHFPPETYPPQTLCLICDREWMEHAGLICPVCSICHVYHANHPTDPFKQDLDILLTTKGVGLYFCHGGVTFFQINISAEIQQYD